MFSSVAREIIQLALPDIYFTVLHTFIGNQLSSHRIWSVTITCWKKRSFKRDFPPWFSYFIRLVHLYRTHICNRSPRLKISCFMGWKWTNSSLQYNWVDVNGACLTGYPFAHFSRIVVLMSPGSGFQRHDKVLSIKGCGCSYDHETYTVSVKWTPALQLSFIVQQPQRQE